LVRETCLSQHLTTAFQKKSNPSSKGWIITHLAFKGMFGISHWCVTALSVHSLAIDVSRHLTYITIGEAALCRIWTLNV
jgi:hypothetical protein